MKRLLIVAIVGAAMHNAHGNSQSPPSKEEVSRQMQINSTLFKKFGEDLRELAKTTGSDVSRSEVEIVDRALPDSNVPASAELPGDPTLKWAIRESDLVAVGHPAGYRVFGLVKGRSWVFTDVQFTVDKVLFQQAKIDSKSFRSKSDEITIAMLDGTVKLDGHLITTTNPNRLPLANGDEYLLFLRYVPLSNSYLLHEHQGYNLSRQRITPLDRNMEMPRGFQPENPSALLNQVEKSVEQVQIDENKSKKELE